MTTRKKKPFWAKLLSALLVTSMLVGGGSASSIVFATESNSEIKEVVVKSENLQETTTETTITLETPKQERDTLTLQEAESIQEGTTGKKAETTTSGVLDTEGTDGVSLTTESIDEEVTEDAASENAILKEFRALLDQMEAFELTEENQEEYQALGMRAAELFEILTGEYYGYEGMEDDMLRFEALADKQSGGTEELAGQTITVTIRAMIWHPTTSAYSGTYYDSQKLPSDFKVKTGNCGTTTFSGKDGVTADQYPYAWSWEGQSNGTVKAKVHVNKSSNNKYGIALANPTRLWTYETTKYEFKGMSKSSPTGTGKPSSFNMPAWTSAESGSYDSLGNGQGVTLFYLFVENTPPSYTYSLHYNGNKPGSATGTVTNMPNPNPQTSGSTTATTWTPTVSSTVPTLTGYTFGGWYLNSTGTGTKYVGGSTVSGFAPTKTTQTLYAKWTPNNYNYSVERYNANTGNLIDTYRTGQAAFGTTITATDADKTMSGYTYKSDDSRRVESAAITTAGATLKLYFTPNQTYYAKVVYNANGDNVTGKPGDYSYSGSEQNPSYTPSGAPSRTGYTFEGWSTTSGENNASGKVITMTLTTSTTSPGPITNLYAIWKSTNAPELVVKKTVSERYVKVGEEVKYTITVKNTGNAVAKNVIVTDALPEGLKWNADGDNSDVISYQSGTRIITGNVGDIEAGQEKTVYFTAKVTKDGEISNIAKAKSDEIITPEESDPCVVTGVNMSIETEKGHDTITVDEKTGVATVPYIVTVENIGDDLYGLDIIEALTATVTDREGNPVDDAVAAQVEVSYQDVQVGGKTVEDSQYKVPMSETGGTITAIPRSEKFAKNQEVTLTYKIKIQNKSQVEVMVKLDNTATGGSWKTDESGVRKLVRVMGMSARLAKASGGYDVTDEAKDNVSVGGSSTTVVIPPVDNGNGIEISKVRENNAATAKIGETIYWEITVENKSNVTKTVTLDEQLEYTTLESPKGTTLQGNKVELTPDESKTVYAKHTVTDTDYEQAGHKLYNTVKASTGGSGDKENPEATDPGTTIDTPTTILSVAKVADKEKVVAGEEVTYTITVSNKSKYDAEDVVIADPLTDANLEFVSWKLNDGTESKDEPSDGSYRIGTVKGNGTAVLTITAKVADDVAEGTAISNTVTVSYSNKPDDPSDPDKKIDDPAATEEIKVVDEPTVLTIAKTANKENVAAGDTVVYTITVENTGNVATKNVKVTDELPEGLTFVSAKLDGNDVTANADGEYEIPVLSGNTKAELVITATVDTDAVVGTELENTATADYDNKPEKDPGDSAKPFETPEDTATVKVVGEKEADRIITIQYVDENGNVLKEITLTEDPTTGDPYKKDVKYNVTTEIKDEFTDDEGHHYVKDGNPDVSLTGTVEDKDILIKVPYALDDLVDPTAPGADPNNPDKKGDGIPDKYQVTVTFAAVNGIVAGAGEDGTYKLVVTLVKDNGDYATPEEGGKLTLAEAQIPGTTANTGYGNGVWDKEPNGAVIEGDATFTITYSATTPTAPTTPGGGGGTGGGTPDPNPAPGPVPIVPEPAPAAGPTVTPVVTPVAPTPTAAAPAAEAEGPAIEAVEDEEVPLAAGEDEEAPELAALNEEEVPLAPGKGASWALINFALMNLAIFESVMLLIGYFVKTKNDDEEEKRKLKKKGLFRIISLPIAIISLIVFILTEDITLPTALVDKYTIVMLIIAIVQTVMAALSNKKYEDEEEQEA